MPPKSETLLNAQRAGDGAPPPSAVDQSASWWRLGLSAFFRHVGFLPLIFIAEATFYASRAITCAAEGSLSLVAKESILFAIGCLAIYGIALYALAREGTIERHVSLKSWPGIWMPLLPQVVVLAAMSSRPLDENLGSLGTLVRTTPQVSLVALQCIRILAIMSIIKARQGLFPTVLVRFLAVPDLAFGMSAWVLLGVLLSGHELSATAFAVWNLMGFLAIVPVGGLSFSFAAYGWVHEQHPPVTLMLRFPMVLGPSLVVPILFYTNLLSASASLGWL